NELKLTFRVYLIKERIVLMKENFSTRDRIINAAIEVFFENGFSDTTVDDITNYAGVSHGTFYIYFKNKKDALRELLKETFDLLYDATEAPWKREHSYESLRESIYGFFKIYQSHWKVIRTWKEAAMLDAEFMQLWHNLVDQITCRIKQNIEYSIRKGLCQPIDSAVASQALSGMIEHYANNYLMKGETVDLNIISKTLAHIWYYGIYGS
ncbi:MAG: TetR/AcrR family transcriptional regulator, partial [Dethiobacteria bacterium]